MILSNDGETRQNSKTKSLRRLTFRVKNLDLLLLNLQRSKISTFSRDNS